MNTINQHISSTLYQRLLLNPLGLDSDNSSVLWMILCSGALTLAGLWFTGGNIKVVLAMLFLVGVVVLTFLRLDYSFYMLIFAVMLMDQFGIPGFDPLTSQFDYFKNLKEISYIPFFNAGVANPIELHLFLIMLSLFFLLCIKKDYSLVGIPVWPTFLFFLTCLTGSFLFGMRRGGDFLVALWEVRALIYLSIMYVIVPQIIRTRKQINILLWVLIIGITIKALQGVGRFIMLGFTTGGIEVLTNHEDPVFMVTLFILLLGFLVFKSKNKQRLWLLLFLIPILLGFYVAQRRAAYASFMVCFALFSVVLPTAIRWKFLKVVFPILMLIVLYFIAFWNSNSTLGRPVAMIKSGIEKPDKKTNYQDYYSNLYREFEDYDLAYSVTKKPMLGAGFGNKYEMPLPLVRIRFPLRDYIPHNEIFWVLVKMGAIGFFAFWLFFNSFVSKGITIFTRLKDPYLKSVTLFIVIAIINQMVVSFFDLQLTYYRNMVFLGCIMGLMPALENLAIAEEHNEQDSSEKADDDELNN